MKFLYLFIIFLILTACNSSDQIEPIKEETIDFDLTIATQMIEEKEKLIIDLALKEKITKSELEEIEKLFLEKFGYYGKTILSILIPETDGDGEVIDEIITLNETFYPTLFHDGIVINDATIFKIHYEIEAFNQTSLTITQTYIGNDDQLEGWSREYIFVEDQNGEWELHGFSGQLNFVGENFNTEYLKLTY